MTELVTRCRPLLGTFVEVTSECESAIGAAFEAIAKAHSLMSAQEANSDLSRINRFGHLQPVEVDSWTIQVIERAIRWSRLSEGVFDAAAAGARALASGYLARHDDQPEPSSNDSGSIRIGGNTVRLTRPACIDLGGIAKGFAVDRAVDAMKETGAAFGLVNAGGDMAGFGVQPWPVEVVDPRSRRAIAGVAISNGAVATSSILPGAQSTHLPGRDSDILSATVCAPCAMDADALTKIVLAAPDRATACLEVAAARAFVLTARGDVRGIEAEKRAA